MPLVVDNRKLTWCFYYLFPGGDPWVDGIVNQDLSDGVFVDRPLAAQGLVFYDFNNPVEFFIVERDGAVNRFGNGEAGVMEKVRDNVVDAFYQRIT